MWRECMVVVKLSYDVFQVDQAILSEEERVVVVRFGHDWDPTCMQMDEILYKIADQVRCNHNTEIAKKNCEGCVALIIRQHCYFAIVLCTLALIIGWWCYTYGFSKYVLCAVHNTLSWAYWCDIFVKYVFL